MKSLAINAKLDLEIKELPIPQPKSDEVRVKIKYFGICGSDLHYFFDGGGGIVSYSLSNSQTQLDYFLGNIDIPSSTIQQWGASDDIIFDYVANSLSLTIINNQ